MMFGDRNTSFYHISTLVRRKRNTISAIMSNTGEWVHNENEVKEMIRNGFSKLYSASLCSAPSHIQPDSTRHACITDEDQDSLFCKEEIRAGLWSLKAFKAPRPDGLHAGFFQRFWLVVGKSVMEEVKKVFLLKEVPEFLNSTLISLIPKIPGPKTLSNYRPISLCNMVYQIVSKVIVARLRPLLDQVISTFQIAFVSGRRVTDNAILVQELIHTVSRKKGKVGYMAIKIDLEKAYDKLEWSFSREDRRSTRLNSSHLRTSRMPSSA